MYNNYLIELNTIVMQEKVNRITSLIEKFLEERLSEGEGKELNEWLAEADHNRSFFQEITDQTILQYKLKLYASANSEAIWQKTLKIINADEVVGLSASKTFKIPYRPLTRWLGAIFN
jgi:transmembrane sensor